MPEYNRKLANLFNSVEFGDLMVADIAGTSARVSLTEPIDYSIFALNMEPFPYQSNSFQEPSDGVTTGGVINKIVRTPIDAVTNAPDEIIRKTTGIGIIDHILGWTPFDEAIDSANIFTAGTIEENIKRIGVYVLLAIIGLILIIFGLRELTK